MLTAQEVADKMHGRQYRDEDVFTDTQLTEANLLVVYGASDDLLEFRGVISEEFGAWDGATIYLFNSPKGWRLINDGQLEEIEEALSDSALSDMFCADTFKSFFVQAEWCPKIEDKVYASWLITAKLPNGMRSLPFAIMEDEDLYCRGLVIDMNIQSGD